MPPYICAKATSVTSLSPSPTRHNAQKPSAQSSLMMHICVTCSLLSAQVIGVRHHPKVCVCPNSYVEAPNTQHDGIGGGAFGRQSGLDEVLKQGPVMGLEETEKRQISHCLHTHTAERSCEVTDRSQEVHKQEKYSHQETVRGHLEAGLPSLLSCEIGRFFCSSHQSVILGYDSPSRLRQCHPLLGL